MGSAKFIALLMFLLIFGIILTGFLPYFIKRIYTNWEFNKQDNEKYIWGTHM